MAVVTGDPLAADLRLREQAEQVLRELEQLPTLPAVAVRLIALTGDQQARMGDVVRLIESDASLTAAVLRYVHRADLGVRERSLPIERAAALIGFRAIRNLALSLQIHRVLPPPEEGDPLEFRTELWKHALAVACAADMIEELSPSLERSGDAFVCGLLHDIGKIALSAILPKSYQRVVDRVERLGECICDAEARVIGLDHTAAGRRLVSHWRLAPSIVESVWLHHHDPQGLPSRVQHPTLVRAVQLADSLVRRQRIGFSGFHGPSDINDLARSLRLDETHLEKLAVELPGRMAPFCELVGLDEGACRTLYVDSLAKANQELAALNSSLEISNRRLTVKAAVCEALSRLTQGLREDARIEDVCAAIAGAVPLISGAGKALVLVADESTRRLHAGLMAGGDPRSAPAVSLNGERHRDLLGVLADLASRRGVQSAGGEYASLWRRYFECAPSGRLSIVPVDGVHPLVAGILFDGEMRSVAAEEQEDPWGALLGAARLALATAKARIDAEQTMEELLDLNRRLRHAQQEHVQSRSVSMVAQWAAGAAHELNNPLSVISGRAQMARRQTVDPELQRVFDLICEKTTEAAQIVLDLMHFAKPDAPQPQLESLASFLERACQHWREQYQLGPSELGLEKVLPDLTVYTDLDQLRTALDAVVDNAVDACRDGDVRITINSPSRSSDETVRIVVEDQGAGMPPDVVEHAVDPFFSSRPAGRRRGLGLSRAYRLVDINGGRLWIESRPNLGTRVSIELPARPAVVSSQRSGVPEP